MKHGSMKAICLVVAILILAATALPALAVTAKGAYVVELEQPRDRLNVHETPSIYDVVDHLKEGTVVRYQYSDEGWWHVEWWDGDENFSDGYVDGSFLVPIDEDPAQYTCVDNLFVHSTPEIEYGRCGAYHIGKLYTGQKVTVLEQNGNWSKIEYKGETGWVYSIYLVRAD